MSTIVIDAAATAAVVIVLAVVFLVMTLLSAGAGWAWERRGPSRLDRALAQCERDREDAMLARLAAETLQESMERRAEQ